MVYEAIGVYPAPDYFAVESTNGTITVKRDVRNDVLNLGTYTVSQVTFEAKKDGQCINSSIFFPLHLFSYM